MGVIVVDVVVGFCFCCHRRGRRRGGGSSVWLVLCMRVNESTTETRQTSYLAHSLSPSLLIYDSDSVYNGCCSNQTTIESLLFFLSASSWISLSEYISSFNERFIRAQHYIVINILNIRKHSNIQSIRDVSYGRRTINNNRVSGSFYYT